jgi:hypothetical protein
VVFAAGRLGLNNDRGGRVFVNDGFQCRINLEDPFVEPLIRLFEGVLDLGILERDLPDLGIFLLEIGRRCHRGNWDGQDEDYRE